MSGWLLLILAAVACITIPLFAGLYVAQADRRVKQAAEAEPVVEAPPVEASA